MKTTAPPLASPRRLAAWLLFASLAVACGPGTASIDPPSATDDPAEAAFRAPQGPAPWDDGYPREWFYAYKHPASDARWARMAQHVGHPAPELEQLDGWRGTGTGTGTWSGTQALAARRGKVVLLEFWATWCPDCKRAMPVVEATAARLVGEPFEVVQICATKGGETYDETVSKWDVTLPGALDARGVNETRYDVPRWPYYILIDSDGVVRATGLRTDHLDEAVDLLMQRERERGAF